MWTICITTSDQFQSCIKVACKIQLQLKSTTSTIYYAIFIIHQVLWHLIADGLIQSEYYATVRSIISPSSAVAVGKCRWMAVPVSFRRHCHHLESTRSCACVPAQRRLRAESPRQAFATPSHFQLSFLTFHNKTGWHTRRNKMNSNNIRSYVPYRQISDNSIVKILWLKLAGNLGIGDNFVLFCIQKMNIVSSNTKIAAPL